MFKEVYGVYSFAEQAERDLIHGNNFGMASSRDEQRDLDVFDISWFEKLTSSTEQGLQTTCFSTLVDGQHGFDSPFSETASTPALTTSPLSPPSLSPEAWSCLSPLSAFVAPSPVSLPSALTPMTMDLGPGSGDFSYDCNGDNSLGLLCGPFLPEGPTQAPSSLFVSDLVSDGAEEQLATDLFMNTQENAPIVGPDSQVSGHASPLWNCMYQSLDTLAADSANASESTFASTISPAGNTLQPPELMYSSPYPTPQKSSLALPRSPARKAISRNARPKRAAAMKQKSYRDSSASPVPGTPRVPSTSSNWRIYTSEKPKAATCSDDVCEYGFRVWVFEKPGGRIAKWRCRACGTLVGRRPDLHRHFKTCVTREKYSCANITHADGTRWLGCGEIFSRRDACRRHLKKRLTDGRCWRNKPKAAQCADEDEYEVNTAFYEEMVANSKWRAALPAAEKNRLARQALKGIKQDIF